MYDEYLKKILSARVYDGAVETPLDPACNLSIRCDNNVLIKREDMQPVFSFKLRGAINKMAHLTEVQKERGVICASAGNHAQGVAFAARKMGVRAIIVLPTTTPSIKINAVRQLGGEVVLAGDSYDEAYAHALRLEEEQKLSFVHPYDDPDVIAGQGTIGMEILRQHPEPVHAVFCAIGGGGLISGVAAYIKQLRPDTKIIGVETFDADAMKRSLSEGERVRLDQVGLFADGTAVKFVGEETFRLCQKYVDEIVLVDTDAICAAIKDVFEDTRSILEPSGALAVAGLKTYAEQYKLSGKTLIAVASGSNMNFDRLRFVAERAEVGEQREVLFAAKIPERPGSFRRFCSLLGNQPITELKYRFSSEEEATVLVGLQVLQRTEGPLILERLNNHGYPTQDLTQDEMAKLHVRHMVGGRPLRENEEQVYSFEFPERPAALMKFLDAMNTDWNISLFHYRNYGSDYGKVLVGMQIRQGETEAFTSFLNSVGYQYRNESLNSAYALFLK